MAFELAKAFVSIEANTSKLTRDLTAVKSQVGSAMSGIGRMAGAVGIGFGISQVLSFAQKLTAAAEESIASGQRLAAVYKTTGGAVGIGFNQLERFAEKLSVVTATDDEMISNAMAKLLTFKRVTGETFREATKLSIDLSATGFGSIESAAVMLGKALESPVQGMTALQRVGVTLSDSQKQQIKHLMSLNQLWKAQQIILEAVKGQVGGVAEATATPLERARIELGNIQEELGTKIIPLTVQWLELLNQIGKAVIPIASGLSQGGTAISIGNRGIKLMDALSKETDPRKRAMLLRQQSALGVEYMAAEKRELEAYMRERGMEAYGAPAGMYERQMDRLRRRRAGLPETAGTGPSAEQSMRRGWENAMALNVDERDRAVGARQQDWFMKNAMASMQYRLGRMMGGIGRGAGYGMARTNWWFDQNIGGPIGRIFSQDKKSAFGTTSFEGVNDAFQQAMLQQDNPVHKTNKILEVAVARPLEAMVDATQQSARNLAAIAATGIKVTINSLFPKATE